ncbi:MAG: response regulator [Hyphomicrobiaceae bacterium]
MGARVLVVEDEAVVLLELSMVLEDLGYAVAGTASDLDRGIVLARELRFDVALLDINLAGRESWPIAAVLGERGIPFILMSGYTQSTLPPAFAGHPFVSKPYGRDEVHAALRIACGTDDGFDG